MTPVFLKKIVAMVSRKKDPESEKKNLLKQVKKDITQSKFSKFYKIRAEELEPVLGHFFYDMYKTIATAQIFLQNTAKSTLLKQIVIETFMDKDLLDMEARLSPAAIEEQAKTMSPHDLSRHIKQELAVFVAAFDAVRMSAVDQCYNLILIFINFVTFNYFLLLKKFDPNLPEHNFSYQPKFVHIKAASIIENIKDFLEIAYTVDPDQDWKLVRKVLKAYKGDVEVLNFDQWNKLLLRLQEVQKTSIMVLIVRHVDKDPIWQSKPNVPHEHIVQPYLETLRLEAEQCIDEIVNAQRNARIEAVAKTIFGSTQVTRLSYYTDQENEIYLKKNLGGFTHIAELNYLKAFILDYYKKDIRETCELFLIRGQWKSLDLVKQMSDGFHEVMDISEKLLGFDEALANKGTHGSRLRIALLKGERDKNQTKIIGSILNVVNEEARRIMVATTKSLVVVAKHLKNILDDYQKTPHSLLVNWQELESASDTPIEQQIVTCYKKIYNFVQMMQLFMNPSEE
ncbi:MAG: DUF5312 family protein [Treponema sp.]|jgi:hypothetical protein|nr:DUF5312 family protein [Treponema sp.]